MIAKDAIFDLYQYIPFRLVQVQIYMQASLKPERTESAMALAELSQTEFRILVLLASKGPMSPSVIASTYGFDRAMVTRALSQLMKKGLLTNERMESNQRSKLAKLTKLGEEYSEHQFDILQGYSDFLDDALSNTEKAKLFEIMDKLLVAVKAR